MKAKEYQEMGQELRKIRNLPAGERRMCLIKCKDLFIMNKDLLDQEDVEIFSNLFHALVVSDDIFNRIIKLPVMVVVSILYDLFDFSNPEYQIKYLNDLKL